MYPRSIFGAKIIKKYQKCSAEKILFLQLKKKLYFILYSETQCISKLDKIGIFIDMKFH